MADDISDAPLRQHHDMGGQLEKGPVAPSEHELALWEKRIEATLRALLVHDPKILTVDEIRRGIEEFPPELYDTLSYYERWITALCNILVEKGILTRAELDERVAEIGRRRAAE